MNKKLIFRILGALASALIIVSVFVPFVSVTGYTSSIWQSFELTNSLYLPIMIIVFGVIGIIFFSLNVKTEFAYMSTGAITFFIVVQTVDVLNQGTFNTLSLGYYLLIIGAVLTGVMAFLMNLKSNKKDLEPVNNMENEPSILNQIDNLYNNNITSTIPPIQPIEPVLQEGLVQNVPLQSTVQIQSMPSEVNQSLEQTMVQPIPEPQQQLVNPVVEQTMVQPIPEPQQQLVNPVVEQFNVDVQQNSVSSQVAPVANQQQLGQDYNTTSQLSVNEPNQINPVVQEFMDPNANVMTETNLNKDAVDIFGQPINK